MDTRTGGVGVGSGGLGAGAARTQGHSQTLLSQGAAPPAERDTGGVTLVSLLLAVVAGAIAGQANAILGWAVLVVVFVSFYKLVVSPISVWNATVLPKLVRRWENTFLCTRCGEQFVHELDARPSASATGANHTYR